eukprot:2735641-Pyramimonas_sp.AAC.2
MGAERWVSVTCILCFCLPPPVAFKTNNISYECYFTTCCKIESEACDSSQYLSANIYSIIGPSNWRVRVKFLAGRGLYPSFNNRFHSEPGAVVVTGEMGGFDAKSLFLFYVTLFSALGSVAVDAYLSPLSCGDNFCCLLTTAGSIKCWGGLGSDPPTGTSFKAISCGGKACVAVDNDNKLSACWGNADYGTVGCTTGSSITDVSMSFWGGCRIDFDTGALACWGQQVMYGSNGQPTLAGCTSN